MAPLNPNNTDRIKVTYQNAIAQHTVLIRVASAADIEDAGTAFAAITVQLSGHFNFSEVTGVEYAAAGVDLFNPIASPSLDGLAWGSGPASKLTNPNGATFIGRSAAGRRGKFTLFGYSFSLSEYRLTSGESEEVENVVAILNAAETSFLAIDGNPVIWKGYADIKANDHWVGKSRG